MKIPIPYTSQLYGLEQVFSLPEACFQVCGVGIMQGLPHKVVGGTLVALRVGPLCAHIMLHQRATCPQKLG